MRNRLSARDRDFLAACRRYIARSSRTDLTVSEVTAAVAAEPAPAYYLTYEYALRILREKPADTGRGTAAAIIRRRRELTERFNAYMAANPSADPRDAVMTILESTASSYFISPETARRIYSHSRRPRKS